MKKSIKNVFAALTAVTMLSTVAASVSAEDKVDINDDGIVTYFNDTPCEKTSAVYVPEGVEGIADLAFRDQSGDTIYAFVPSTVKLDKLGNTAFLTAAGIERFVGGEGLDVTDEKAVLEYVAGVIKFADKAEGWTDEELATVKEWFQKNLEIAGAVEGDDMATGIIKLITEYNKGDECALEMSQKSKDNFGLWIATLPAGFAIVGDVGSDVEAYAEGKNISFFVRGDNNGDDKLNVRDAASIAAALANVGKDGFELKEWADYNTDGQVNVRDAAAIANMLATAKG